MPNSRLCFHYRAVRISLPNNVDAWLKGAEFSSQSPERVDLALTYRNLPDGRMRHSWITLGINTLSDPAARSRSSSLSDMHTAGFFGFSAIWKNEFACHVYIC